MSLIVIFLTIFSFINAGYTFARARNYRLFHVNIEATLDTPNAHRVRVQSNSASGSPFRFLLNMIVPETAESRAHPNKTLDVWELAVWDPLPLCMRLFCFFSPGHILVYYMFLPLLPLNPRPSVTVFNCIVLQALLTAQLFLLHSQYERQAKDQAIIKREVMHEYDVKFVQPRSKHTVRDVGTQLARMKDGRRVEYVSTGTPTTQIVGCKFETHPNPNYAKHYDPEEYSREYKPSMSPLFVSTAGSKIFTPTATTPPAQVKAEAKEAEEKIAVNPFAPRPKVRESPVMRRSMPNPGTIPSCQTHSVGTGSTQTHGGSLGVYQHAKSPLKKMTSMNEMNIGPPRSPRNSREMAALEQQGQWPRYRSTKHGSPIKDVWSDASVKPLAGERYPKLRNYRQ